MGKSKTKKIQGNLNACLFGRVSWCRAVTKLKIDNAILNQSKRLPKAMSAKTTANCIKISNTVKTLCPNNNSNLVRYLNFSTGKLLSVIKTKQMQCGG